MGTKPGKSHGATAASKPRTKKPASRGKPKRTLADVPQSTKLAALIAVLSTPKGATLAQMTALTGWQPHSVRGVISGMIKKQLGMSVVSKKIGDERVYRVAGKP